MFLGLRFSCMGRCWVLDWECWELIFYVLLIDLTPPTHTTHTYIHIFGASFSVALGVVTSADVCVCSCRGRSQTIRHVCSVCASHFSISSFEVANHWVYRMYSSHSTASPLHSAQTLEQRNTRVELRLLPLPLRNLPYVVNTKQSKFASVTNVPRRFLRTYTTWYTTVITTH